ncbi:MAG: DUF131 domain-containing protein [Candidatus Bathyarchaeia archaeon]
MNLSAVSIVAGWAMIIAGIIIFFVAMIMVIFGAAGRRGLRGRFRGGGLIMLGPIPIIFGTDKEAVKVLIILSIVLIVIMLVLIMAVSFLPAARLGGL